MSKELHDAVSGIIERLTGEEADPEQVERLAQPPGEITPDRLTEDEKVKLGEIATRFEAE